MRNKIIIIILTVLFFQHCASREKKLIKERENNPRYQFNVGIVYLNNGDLEEAEKYLNKALALELNYDLALDGLGLIYFMRGEFNVAVQYLEKCLAKNPKMTDAQNHLGAVYQELGMLDKAEELFLAALADQTYHSRELPHYNLARLHFLRNDFKKSLDYVNQALSINPRMVLAHNLQGILYENLDQIPASIASYRQALGLSPDDVTLKFNLAGAYFKNKEYSRAKEIFIQIQPLVTDNSMRENLQKYLDMIEKLEAKKRPNGLSD